MKPQTLPLNERQISTLENGLRVAAERFDEHAAEFTKSADALATKPAPADGDSASFDIMPQNPEAFRSMARQFEQQAAETRALLAMLDGPKGVEDYMGDVTLAVTYTPEDAESYGPNARP